MSEAARVCFFADVHYAPGKQSGLAERHYEQGLQRLRQVLAEPADLYVNLGDLIDGYHAPQAYDAVLSLLAQVPCLHVAGNHDAFALPADAMKGSGFAAYDWRGLRWIVLDSNYYADDEPYGGHEGDWTRAWIPAAQQRMLQEVLADCSAAVVLCHHNLDAREDERFLADNAEAVRTILEQSGKVQAVIQGHYHEGYRQSQAGIPYYTLPAVCESAMVRYALAEVKEGKLENFRLCEVAYAES